MARLHEDEAKKEEAVLKRALIMVGATVLVMAALEGILGRILRTRQPARN
jgi:hypothetical protein